MKNKQPTSKQSGFTIIELMIAVLIAGILLAYGVPSMRTFIQNNRIESESQRLFTILKQARNNAIVTNTPSLVCRSTLAQTSVDGEGIECRIGGVDANDWALDLMMYSAMPGVVGPDALFENQQIQALAAGNAERQALLKTVSEAPNNGVEVTANRDDYVIRFNPDGSLDDEHESPYRFGICDDRDNAAFHGRYIEINSAGQIRLNRIEPDDPARGCSPT